MILSFAEHKFYISLFDSLSRMYQSSFEHASDNMISAIKMGLEVTNISIEDITKIAFLIGPGSFTSIRLCTTTILAIQYAYPDKIYIPMKLDEMSGIDSIPIIVKCTQSLYHIFIKNNWQLMNINQIYSMTNKYAADTKLDLDMIYMNIDHHQIHENTSRIIRECKNSRKISAFYNLDIVR